MFMLVAMLVLMNVLVLMLYFVVLVRVAMFVNVFMVMIVPVLVFSLHGHPPQVCLFLVIGSFTSMAASEAIIAGRAHQLLIRVNPYRMD